MVYWGQSVWGRGHWLRPEVELRLWSDAASLPPTGDTETGVKTGEELCQGQYCPAVAVDIYNNNAKQMHYRFMHFCKINTTILFALPPFIITALCKGGMHFDRFRKSSKVFMPWQSSWSSITLKLSFAHTLAFYVHLKVTFLEPSFSLNLTLFWECV